MIFLLIIVIVAVILAYIISFVRAFVDKLLFHKILKEACKTKGFKVEFPRIFLASLFRYAGRPDVVVETPTEKYLIRFINCDNKSLCFNFPSPEWYVSFENVLSAMINPTGRFKHLPRFKNEYLDIESEREVKQIMIFAPSFPKISYLDEQKAQKKIGGRGTNLEYWIISDEKYFLEQL